METRGDLFFRTGWLFVTADVFPILREVEVVQRFKSAKGDWVHEVRLSDERASCGCPGWRKRGKCWHVRFVLRWNFSGREPGSHLVRLPDAEDARSRTRNRAWVQWFEDHVAVLPANLGPRSRVEPGSSDALDPRANHLPHGIGAHPALSALGLATPRQDRPDVGVPRE